MHLLSLHFVIIREIFLCAISLKKHKYHYCAVSQPQLATFILSTGLHLQVFIEKKAKTMTTFQVDSCLLQ